MMDIKTINFKQPKYIIPALVYLGGLIVGYFVIDMFYTDVSGPGNSKLKTTNYLSSELPEAYTDSVLGDKMDNTSNEYGKITDLSGVQNVENDNDSVNQKQEYDSKYSDAEGKAVREQQAEEKRKLKEMQERVRANRSDSKSEDFVDPVSDTEIAQAQRRRRQRSWEEMNRSLSGSSNLVADRSSSTLSGSKSSENSSLEGEDGNESSDWTPGNSGTSGSARSENSRSSSSQRNSSDSEEQPEKVVKKTKEVSEYFNTVGRNKEKDKLITAIIDENVKAVDGSRVRLRLLDDIEIGGELVKKGTYLYATMSGFGKQRVQGKVESVFYDDEIIKVSLSIYDTDGMEGLYVPVSNFSETAKDVASQAMQGGNVLDNSSTASTGIKSWANQAAQNASRKVMSAFGTAIKKNRVRLKYGTRVYLVDGSQKDKKKNNR